MLGHSDTRKQKRRKNFLDFFGEIIGKEKGREKLFSTDSFLSKQTIRRLRVFFLRVLGLGFFVWGGEGNFSDAAS